MNITEVILAAIALAIVGWLLTYMVAQKPVTDVQRLIQSGKFDEALDAAKRILEKNPRDSGALLHHAEAAKLLGRFEKALESYTALMTVEPADAAAREGVALSLAHLSRDLPRAQRLMEETIQTYPAVQEFQALALSFILLRQGKRDESLRIFEDNAVLLQTRFELDYTDPDPLLAETLYLFAILSKEAGDAGRSESLQRTVREWAPGSVFARSGLGAQGSGLGA